MRGLVVLGLGEQVGGDPGRIVVAVGDHHHLRRARHHVDADLAEHLALGGGDIGIAGADDLGDGRDALGAVSERGDRLRAARRDRSRSTPASSAATSTSGLSAPFGAGTTMTMRGTPATLAGTRVHQHRARIARRAARHVEAGGGDRRPARAKLDARAGRV